MEILGNIFNHFIFSTKYYVEKIDDTSFFTFVDTSNETCISTKSCQTKSNFQLFL